MKSLNPSALTPSISVTKVTEPEPMRSPVSYEEGRSRSLLALPQPGPPPRKGVNLAQVTPEQPMRVGITGAVTVEGDDPAILAQMRGVVMGFDSGGPSLSAMPQGGETFTSDGQFGGLAGNEEESPTYIAQIRMPEEEKEKMKGDVVPSSFLPPPRRRQIAPDAGSPLPLSSLMWGGSEATAEKIASSPIGFPTSESHFSNIVKPRLDGPGPTKNRYEVPVGNWERVGMLAGTEDLPEDQYIWQSSLRPYLDEPWRARVKKTYEKMSEKQKKEIDLNVRRSTADRSSQIRNMLKSHRGVLEFEKSDRIKAATDGEIKAATDDKIKAATDDEMKAATDDVLRVATDDEIKGATVMPEELRPVDMKSLLLPVSKRSANVFPPSMHRSSRSISLPELVKSEKESPRRYASLAASPRRLSPNISARQSIATISSKDPSTCMKFENQEMRHTKNENEGFAILSEWKGVPKLSESRLQVTEEIPVGVNNLNRAIEAVTAIVHGASSFVATPIPKIPISPVGVSVSTDFPKLLFQHEQTVRNITQLKYTQNDDFKTYSNVHRSRSPFQRTRQVQPTLDKRHPQKAIVGRPLCVFRSSRQTIRRDHRLT